MNPKKINAKVKTDNNSPETNKERTKDPKKKKPDVEIDTNPIEEPKPKKEDKFKRGKRPINFDELFF